MGGKSLKIAGGVRAIRNCCSSQKLQQNVGKRLKFHGTLAFMAGDARGRTR